MIKKYGYLLSLFLIFSLHLEAKSLLYKVSSEGSTVYILGSIHLAKPELYPLAKEIESAYTRSDVLVLELDPSSPESVQSIQGTMMRAGIYPPGHSLKSELSAYTYNLLQQYAHKAQIQTAVLEQMRPWVVMLQLSVMEMMRLGYSPELGIDQHFLKRYKEDGKELYELETAQEQMALLSKDDKKFQDMLLRYTLESMHEMEPMLEEMFQGWKRGDDKAFDRIMTMSLKSDPALDAIYDALITKRNYKMTEQINDFLKTKKDYFVVVGAGHVVGEEGIVALLKRQGYTPVQQ